MIKPEHIHLDGRKKLFTRLAFFDSVYSLNGRIGRDKAAAHIDSLRDDLFLYVEGYVEGQGRSESLDQLRGIFDSYNPPGGAVAGHGPLCNYLLKRVRDKVHEVTCLDCTSHNTKICNGRPRDAEIVAASGLCIKPLLQTFAVAQEAARRYYQEYGTVQGQSQFPQMVLSTKAKAAAGGRVHDLPVPYNVNGTTSFLPSEDDTQVELTLIPTEFDLRTYLAVPYVMFHECVAHGFHDIVPTPRNRIAAYASDAFCEGWMDWIALQVMRDMYGGRGPAADLLPAPGHFLDNLKRAQNFHFARIDTECEKPSANAGVLAPGVRAAEKMYNLLGKLFNFSRPLSDDIPASAPYRSDAKAALYRMSFDLNMLRDFDKDKRLVFIALVDLLPDFLSDEDEIEEPYVSIKKIVFDYLVSGDLTAFIDDSFKLSRMLAPGVKRS